MMRAAPRARSRRHRERERASSGFAWLRLDKGAYGGPRLDERDRDRARPPHPPEPHRRLRDPSLLPPFRSNRPDADSAADSKNVRSEERRVGKEGKYR